jgi:hypothetical protein
MVKKKVFVPDDCMPKCSTCAFFVPDRKDELGECRRFPPAVFPDGDDGLGFSFSMTQPDQWCGEFRRRLSE